MPNEIPATTMPCDGCGEELNLLSSHLSMILKAQRSVLVTDTVESDDLDEVPESIYYLGTKAGRGVIKKFHDFACLDLWVEPRKELKAKLEVHREEEIYVPEDNPTEEEIAQREAEAAKVEANAAKAAAKGGE
jgi:hypothetical protein